MALFNFRKKKEKSSCCCSENYSALNMEQANEKLTKGATVKVLGSGCAKCNELAKNVEAALKQMGLDSTIEHVTDFTEIAAYGVMTTPALVVDGKVVSYGKVLKTEEAVELLQKQQ